MHSSSNVAKETRLSNFLGSSLFHVALIIILGFSVYSNTFQAPFEFDTPKYVTDNEFLLKNPSVLFDAASAIEASSISDTFKTGILTRRVSLLTFALNYQLHGLEVYGYHLVNILVHVINGLLLYWLFVLLARTDTPLRGGNLSVHQNNKALCCRMAAFVAGMLFVTHPIQTQAVTYIVQRFASLATLFFLLTLIFYLTSTLSKKALTKYGFYTAALLTAIMAMLSKEISFTLPSVIILIEVIFLKGPLLQRTMKTFPFLITMGIIPYNILKAKSLMTGTGNVTTAMSTLAGNPDLSNLDYLFTQFRVIVTYLRLLFLPIRQNLLYDYPIFHSFLSPQVVFSFLLLLAIVSGGGWLWYRSTKVSVSVALPYRLASFGIFWFFITLSVESSIIPIESVIYEHRLYLPSVGFFIAIVSLAVIVKEVVLSGSKVDALLLPFAALLIITLAGGTYARNNVWRERSSLWKDVVTKSPGSIKSQSNLAKAYYIEEKFVEFEKQAQLVLSLAPTSNNINFTLGQNAMRKEQYQSATIFFKEALSEDLTNAKAWYLLGISYQELKRHSDAIDCYRKALKIDKSDYKSYINLAEIYHNQGQIQRAIDLYVTAKGIKDTFQARYSLGLAYVEIGYYADAINEYMAALKLKPGHSRTYGSLGTAYYYLGEHEEALVALEKALQLDPSNQIALSNLKKLKRINPGVLKR